MKSIGLYWPSRRDISISLIYFATVVGMFNAHPWRLHDIAIVVAITILMFAKSYRCDLILYANHRIGQSLLLLSLWMLLIAIINPSPYVNSYASALMHIFRFLWVYCLIAVDWTHHEKKTLFQLMIAASYCWIFYQLLFGAQIAGDCERSALTSLLSVLCLSAYMFNREHWLYLLSFFIMSLFIIFIDIQRTGKLIYIVLMATFVFQYCRLKLSMTKSMIIGASVVSIIVLFLIYSPVSYNRIMLAGSDINMFTEGHFATSLGIRLLFYPMVYDVFLQNPIMGLGLNGFKHYFNVSDTKSELISILGSAAVGFSHPHSDILYVIAEQGILGFGVFVIFLFSLFRIPSQKKPAWLFVMIALVLFSLTDVFWYTGRFIIFGILYVIYSNDYLSRPAVNESCYS